MELTVEPVKQNRGIMCMGPTERQDVAPDVLPHFLMPASLPCGK